VKAQYQEVLIAPVGRLEVFVAMTRAGLEPQPEYLLWRGAVSYRGANCPWFPTLSCVHSGHLIMQQPTRTGSVGMFSKSSDT